jgi:hypothetical protein
VRTAVGALAIFVVALVVVPTGASGAAPAQLRAPLASAISTPTGSWSIAAMGHLRQPANTFWELFFRAPGATRWTLVTPPGVADNGGLVGAASAGGFTVGVEPSQRLRYSPLAQTTDGGAHWTPALVPTALAAAPDALADEPAAPGVRGRALALVRTGRVLSSGRSLATWVPLVSAKTLDAVGTGSCGVTSLSALALGVGNQPLVGTNCRGGGQVGLFAETGGVWRRTGPTLAGSLSGSATRVLRLDVADSLTAALVAARTRRGTSLVALWRSAGGPWTVSTPLRVGPHETLLSTGVDADGRELVLFGSPDRRATPAVISPGGSWMRLPAPPAGTVTLVPMSDGSVDAFGVTGSALRVYALAQGSSAWVRSQSMEVPIVYGTSS